MIYIENTTIDKVQSRSGLIMIAVVSGLGMFLVGFDSNLFFFGGKFIFSAIHINQFYLGIASTGFAVGITIFSMIGGYIFDRITTRNGIIISLAIISLFSTLTGFATNTFEVVAFRFLVGFGTGMIQPEIFAFLGGLRPKIRATLIATGGVAFNLGLAVGPLIFAGFSTATSYDIPFIIAGIAGLVLIGITIALVPSRYRPRIGAKKGIIGNMNRSLLLASLSYLFFGIAFFAYESYFTPYLTAHGLSKGAAATVLALFGVSGIVFAYPGAIAGDRLNRKRIIQLATLMIFIGTIVMFGVTVTFVTAVVGVVLFGGGYAIYANIQAFAQESVEEAWIGTAEGFLFTIFNVGTIIGGPLMGTLGAIYGYRTGGIFSLVIPMAISLALISLAPSVAKRTSALTSEEVEKTAA